MWLTVACVWVWVPALRHLSWPGLDHILVCSTCEPDRKAHVKFNSYGHPFKLSGKRKLDVNSVVMFFPIDCARTHRPQMCVFFYRVCYFMIWTVIVCMGPPLWSSGQSFWLQIQRSRVRFPALPDFLSGSGSGTGYTQPREVNWWATWIKISSDPGSANID